MQLNSLKKLLMKPICLYYQTSEALLWTKLCWCSWVRTWVCGIWRTGFFSPFCLVKRWNSVVSILQFTQNNITLHQKWARSGDSLKSCATLLNKKCCSKRCLHRWFRPSHLTVVCSKLVKINPKLDDWFIWSRRVLRQSWNSVIADLLNHSPGSGSTHDCIKLIIWSDWNRKEWKTLRSLWFISTSEKVNYRAEGNSLNSRVRGVSEWQI